MHAPMVGTSVVERGRTEATQVILTPNIHPPPEELVVFFFFLSSSSSRRH